MRLHKGDTIPGLLTITFGLIFFIPATKFSFMSTTSDGVPGAGFFPIVISSLVIILGAVLFIKGIKQNGSVQYLEITDEVKRNLKVLVLTIIGLVALCVLWKLTNQFILITLLFFMYINKVYERSWKFTIIYSVAFIVFIYATFVMGFSIRFKV